MSIRLIALMFLGISCPALNALAQDDLVDQSDVSVLEQIEEERVPVFNPDEMVESTVFDLYLSDQFQGAILVTYTDDWFEIDDVRDLVDQLQDIKKPDNIDELLKGRIEKFRQVPGVGNVRYDLRTFRIIVALDPAWLPQRRVSLLGRLPDPENEFALLQSFGGASSGQFGEDFNSSLTHRTIASRGKFFGLIDGTAVEDGDYLLTEGSVSGIVGEYEIGAGLLETKGQNFASSVDIAGIKIETSDDIFLNQDGIRGSKLEIFVPSRSRVEFFREERLLGVQVLDFGLQEVDTSRFPDGSYDIEVVINEDNGNVTRERRFFTKSGYLAIQSKPILFLQAGALRDRLDFLSVPVVQSGARWRATSVLELRGSVYGTEEVILGEVETVGVYRDYIFSGGGSVSDNGDSGLTGSINGNILGLNFVVGGSKTLDGGLDQSEVTYIQPDGPGNRPPVLSGPDRARLVAPKRSTFNASIAKTIGKLQLRFVANKNKRTLFENVIPEPGEPIRQIRETDRYAYGPRLEYRLFENRKTTVRLEASYLDTDEGSKYGAGISLRYKLDDNLTLTSDGLGQKESSGNQANVRNALIYDRRERTTAKGIRAMLTNEVRSEEKPSRDTFTTNQVLADYVNDYVESSGFFRDVSLSENDNSSIGINAKSSFIYANNTLDVSYPPKEGAIFIADIKSASTSDKFDLIVNGQNYAVVEAGKKSVIGLHAFKSYRIGIRPQQKSDLVDYDAKTYDVTLFPGNIIRKTWEVEKVTIAVGRLVDKNGDPIARQRIKGTRDYTATEEDGTFQMELTGNENLYLENRRYSCKIYLDSALLKEAEYVADLGDLPCQ